MCLPISLIMPKTLTKRLENLENEIRVLLTLQEIETNCCQVLKGTSITTNIDGNIEQIDFEGRTCRGAKSICSSNIPTTPIEQSPNSCCCPKKSPQTQHKSAIPIPKTPNSALETHKSASVTEKVPDTALEKSGTPKQRANLCICTSRKEESKEKKDEAEEKLDHEKSSKRKKKSDKGKEKKGPSGDKNEISKLEASNKEQEDKLLELQEYLIKLENQLRKAEREKTDALKQTQQYKIRSDKLSASKDTDLNEIQRLKDEKAELGRLLELEEKNRCLLEEKAKACFQREKRNFTMQMEKLEVHAAKSAKKVKQNSEDLVSAVKTRDDHIRKLSNTTDKLASSITEKEHENNRLTEAHKEAIQNFVDAQNNNKKLIEANSTLSKNLRDVQEKLKLEKLYTQKVVKQFNQGKFELDRLREEIERLRIRLKTALEGPKEARLMSKLEEKLRDSREREQVWLDEAAVMEAKLKELEQNQQRASEAFDSELEIMRMCNVKLKNKYERALEQVEQLKIDNEARITEMKHDFDNLSAEFTKKLEHLQNEKNKLQRDFNQLVTASQRDRKALEELIARTKKQDIVIKEQQGVIHDKEKKVNTLREENVNLKEHSKVMEKKINTLKNTLEENMMGSSEYIAEIENLKTQVHNEREEVIRKDVVIAQHICKIEHLQHALDNTENKLKSSLEESQIAAERAKKTIDELNVVSCKLQIMEDRLARAEEQKEPIVEEKISKNESPFSDSEFLAKKVGIVSKQFERKVALLEKEKEIQLSLVIKQKDQATYAAKFATQKLLETVTDFQKQVHIHKQIQQMLTNVLQEKENNIESIPEHEPCSKDAEQSRRNSKNKRCSSPCCVNK